MSPRALKIHWLLLGVASVVVAAGSITAHISSSPVIATLTLSPGELVTLPVRRLLPDVVRLSLSFERPEGARRPELGSFSAKKDADGALVFPNPGEPVIVRVAVVSGEADFEALPLGSYSDTQMNRGLVVRKLDGDPRRFRWPPDNAARPILPAGASTVTLHVLEVGPALTGERVTVILKPPLSFKAAAPGYAFLWWFHFWPLYAVLLCGYLVYIRRQAWLSRTPRA